MVDFDKPLGAKRGVNRTVNARDRRLLTEAVQAIGRMGVQRAHEVSDIPTSTLNTYAAGKLPKYLQLTTRAGLRKLLRFDTEPDQGRKPKDALLGLAGRACDALEEIAVALVIIAEKVDPRDDL
jgi:hypothetical protein